MTPDSPKGPESASWEPLYGFCAENKHSNESMAKALEAVRRRVCAYGGRGRCDCKYGRDVTQTQRAGSEKTGCPELVEVIHRLLHRPESFAPELERLTAELQAQNRLYRAVGSERDEKQFEIELLRRWVDRFRERAAEHAAEVSRLREQLAAQPKVPVDAAHQFSRLVHLYGSEMPEEISDFPEACVELVRSWGVSSSEVEAPQQHKVTFESVYPGVHRAVCRTCGQDSGEGVGEYAALWRDQHEADTLVPQAEDDERVPTLEALRSQRRRYARDEGRPSGSERLAPRPMETGLVLVSRAELVSGMLVGISGEHDPVPTQQQLDRAADLIIRAARRRDRTKEGQVRLLAVLLDHQCAETGCTDKAVDGDVVCSEHLLPDEPEQDAAQAARSEATPEELPEVDPDAFGFAGYLLQPPSPSLPKEGEDTPPVARRAVYAHPGYDYEYGEEGERVGINAGWDLAFGCRVSFGLDEGESYVVVSMSDRELRDGSCNRSVTREQIRGFAYYLIQMTEEMDEFLPSVSSQVEKEGETDEQ